MKIVAVTWVDTQSEDDVCEHEAQKLATAEAVSYGLLLLDDGDKVNIASTRFDEGDYRQVLSIPRAAVKAITELKGVGDE